MIIIFIIANFLEASGFILRIIINIFTISIIISALLSFIMPYYNKYKAIIDSIAGVILNPIRKYLKLNLGFFDFTPIIGILILVFIDRFLVQTILDIAARLA